MKDPSFIDESKINKMLNELDEKTPSRDVLLKTRLGFVLKDLSTRKGLSPGCQNKAANLRVKWKGSLDTFVHKIMNYSKPKIVYCIP